MRIHLASVYVDDQDKALSFYTEILGFAKKEEFPVGDFRWLTVVSPGDEDGTELLLEPDAHPAVKPFKDALVDDGIPFTSFAVEDVNAEYERHQPSASASRSGRPISARRRRLSSRTRAAT
jgi:catechol 2,3-dioxygenase-like lactoylglutathione lyase family enzyme